MPYAKVFVNVFERVFREGTKYFKKSSIKSELKGVPHWRVHRHASVPYRLVRSASIYFLSVQCKNNLLWRNASYFSKYTVKCLIKVWLYSQQKNILVSTKYRQLARSTDNHYLQTTVVDNSTPNYMQHIYYRILSLWSLFMYSYRKCRKICKHSSAI